MRRLFCVLGVSCLLASLCVAGTLSIVPTTTLKAQTSNNTSAADSFTAQSNGNLGAGSVSKVSIRSLLYPGASTRIYAHLMLWFGASNHMNVGYSSTDSTQIKRQVGDMISRGINGVMIDWYGAGSTSDRATQLVMNEAEANPGFTFAVIVDQGAIRSYSCSGCSPQQALIKHLQYVEQTYFTSPAYMKIGGRPVVTNFDIDLAYTIDWNAVNAALATKPLFLFQNKSGFTHVLSSGSYSWVMPSTTDYGMTYLTDFYTTGQSYPSKQTTAATYKGFNDTLAAWTKNRVMGQQCGQTWLKTFSKINGMYNSSRQLPLLQLVTWNDYEEGTEIETGIDNCLSISASMSGGALQWKISGQENTLDHYRVYISKDGQNLMALADFARGIYSLNLCSYSLATYKYTLYVKAVGKAGIRNHLSNAVSYTPACTATSSTGSALNLSLAPTALTLRSGAAGQVQVGISPQSGTINTPVQLSCSNLPSGFGCAFAPASVAVGTTGGSSVLTISASSNPVARNRRKNGDAGILYPSIVPIFGMMFAFPAISRPQRRILGRLKVLFLLPLVGILASCGGLSSSGHNAQVITNAADGAYTITVNADAGSTRSTATAIVTIH